MDSGVYRLPPGSKNKQLEMKKGEVEEKAEELCREIFDLKQNCSQEVATETIDRYSAPIKDRENTLGIQISENN